MAKVKLNLAGLDGNAFSLLGAYRRAAREQGVPKPEVDAVCEEAKTGDYNHLVSVLLANTEEYDEDDELDNELCEECGDTLLFCTC